MERIWIFGDIAVCVERIDFLDPAVEHEPDARERGVRVELRPVTSSRDGSIYSSSTTTVAPGSCRFDLLESRPGAADRMHWHPSMHDGEPGARVFDAELGADPMGWLGERLREAAGDETDEILAEVSRGLDWARQPWPAVERDDRGLAVGG
jgi:hypothetical protein